MAWPNVFTALDLSQYTKLIEKLAEDLQSGKIKATDISEDLVRQTYKDLARASAKGYGKSFYNYERNGKQKLSLQQNIYRFSAAKTYQEQALLNSFLLDENGQRRNAAEVKKLALAMNEEFNSRHLQTEVNTFQRTNAQAEKWNKYQEQKDLYPNLQYKTAKDDRVRDDHEAVDDIIKPVEDKFWDKWYPPNGWNCRCYVVQTDKPATSGTPAGNPTLGFQNNPGKTGNPVDPEHPYFIFPDKDARKIRSSFEDLKLKLPQYNEVHKKGSGSLEVSVWADPEDIVQNIAAGKVLVNSLKAKVKIRPHVNSAIKKKYKNPELEINGVVGDLKNITSNSGITNGFKTAKGQMGALKGYTVLFNLDGIKKLDLTAIKEQLNNKISPQRGIKIKSIFINYKGKAIELTRDEIIKRNYKKLDDLVQ